MGGRALSVAVSLSVLLGACGGTGLLGTSSLSGREYLAKLRSEQARLSTAERAIPRLGHSRRALFVAIGLLRRAVEHLSVDLSSIHPPSKLSAQHAQLVSIVRTYAGRLRAAEAAKRTPSGELQAARMLLSATDSASRSFSSTVAQIDRMLR